MPRSIETLAHSRPFEESVIARAQARLKGTDASTLNPE
jgi:hypothetical protein